MACCSAGCLRYRLCRTGCRRLSAGRYNGRPRLPEQSAKVVRTGIYKFSRNPMYVGFFLMLLAWSVNMQQLLAVPLLVAFVAYLTRYQIIPEERFLKDKFGNEYIDYCRQVRRWL